MHTITTARLTLRPLEVADAEDLQAVFGDPDVMVFGDGVLNKTQVDEWIQQKTADQLPLMAVCENGNKAAVGYCGLFAVEIDGVSEIEIGYRLAKQVQGKGYATEAAQRLLQYAHESLKFDRVVAMIDPGNVASANVARKLGMSPEKEFMMSGYDHPDVLYVSGRGTGTRR